MKTLLSLILILNLFAAYAQESNTSEECRADFKWAVNTSVMSIVPSLAVDFFDKSEGNINSWHWDFGDGSTSDEQNPMHIFVYPMDNDSIRLDDEAIRTITLTVSGDNGCGATTEQEINIYDPNSWNSNECMAMFRPNLISFDSINQTASYTMLNYSEGEDLSYDWKFGDGLSSTEKEPQITFSLEQPERKICLKVSNASGCDNIFCTELWVDPSNNGNGDPVDTIIYEKCFVEFGYDVNHEVNTFAPALVLNFYSKVDGEALTYHWDFGDGTTSDEANPTHIFNFPLDVDSVLGDVYAYRTVCLTITTVDGCENSWCERIYIYMDSKPEESCNAYFKYYRPDDIMTIAEIVPFKFVAAQENVVEYNWYFEDGTVSHEAEPIAYFDALKKSEQVCLSIVTEDSCMSKWCETIYLQGEPVDTFNIEPYCKYRFSFTGSFPEEASACIGEITAQVVDGDFEVPTDYYYWMTSEGKVTEGPVLTGACPTNTYTVTALTNDGCKFSASIVFNSDGSVKELPMNWRITEEGDHSKVEAVVLDSSYTIEWILCDGSVVSDSDVLLSDIDCGTGETNMVLKDADGNIVYSESVGTLTSVPELGTESLLLYPNPVDQFLFVRLNTNPGNEHSYSIFNLNGKLMQKGNFGGNKAGVISIDVSGLNKGTYLFQIKDSEQHIIKSKFIK